MCFYVYCVYCLCIPLCNSLNTPSLGYSELHQGTSPISPLQRGFFLVWWQNLLERHQLEGRENEIMILRWALGKEVLRMRTRSKWFEVVSSGGI
jgi:hypothetical protein